MYVQCTLYHCEILWHNPKYHRINYPNCVLLFQYWYFWLKIMVSAQWASCATINAFKKTNFIKKVKEKGWCNEIHAFHIAIFLFIWPRFMLAVLCHQTQNDISWVVAVFLSGMFAHLKRVLKRDSCIPYCHISFNRPEICVIKHIMTDLEYLLLCTFRLFSATMALCKSKLSAAAKEANQEMIKSSILMHLIFTATVLFCQWLFW